MSYNNRVCFNFKVRLHNTMFNKSDKIKVKSIDN